jgi:uncharacterized protein DUF4037
MASVAEPGRESGLALSRRLWEVRGRALLEELGLLERCAVGCVGGTSQNAGLDDAASRDHAWGPYLTFWLFEEDWEREHERLERAVKAMPDEVDGVASTDGSESRRSGVRAAVPFLRGQAGLKERPKTAAAWLPYLQGGSFLGKSWQERLFDGGQGAVFHDPGGRFTRLWREWTAYVPLDVQRALLARSLFRVWNAGPEYNLARMLGRGDRLAYTLCLARFVDEVMALGFTLSGMYVPYYKWRVAHFRRLAGVPDGLREGLDATVGEAIPERQLEIAREVVVLVKEWVLERFPLDVGEGATMSWFAQRMRASIEDEGVRRQASLDW